MKIKIIEFGARHFDPKFGGTKILNMTKEEVEEKINKEYDSWKNYGVSDFKIVEHDGYADFCKLVAVTNFTDARVGSMPITLENYQYIRSGYSARRESELPVFSRWLDLPLGKPEADYLVFVLYDKEQIDKESKADAIKKLKELHFETFKSDYEEYVDIKESVSVTDKMEADFEMWLNFNKIDIIYEKFDADWGVVAILGQSHPNEEPMKPETMLRNALGKEEGGSGTKLDKTAYRRSVEFWDKNATVK